MKILYRVILLYILFILACFNAKAQSTYSINGIVSDGKGSPVPGATVFITNSKQVTATNSAGKFNFENIQPGTYEVVIKMLGFNPVVQNITLREKSVKIIVGLTESITTLNTVNITAKKSAISTADKSRYLDIFLESFIGRTVNAENCKLLNPEVLNFDYKRDTKILKVTADDFLVIENKALGYKIKYLLNNFENDFKSNICSYDGYPYFEELKGTANQQKKWDENRRLAYLSSARHFFRALMNNTLKEEGYTVYLCTSLVKRDNELNNGWIVRSREDKTVLKPNAVLDSGKYTAIPLDNAASLFFTVQKDRKQIVFTPQTISKSGRLVKNTAKVKDTVALKYIYVVYTGEKESALFYKTGIPADLFPFIKLPPQQKNHRQISQLFPLADTVMIDKNGGLSPIKGFRYTNYWAWQRIADLTPLDYFVAPVISDQSADEIKNEKNPGLKGVIAAVDTLRSHLPIEKLYLQTDKPYYTLGDTLWFKSYLLNADYLTPSAKSGLLYVELDNATGRMVKRIMVPVTSGISWGDIALDEKGVPEGSYTLRAYTNWMRNFGEDYVFKKNIYISALSNSTLVKASFKLDSLSGKNKVTADLTFTGLNKDPIRVKDMQLKLMNGRHNLFKDKATTDMTGNMNLNFDLADKTQLKDLSIIANQTGKGITDTATLTIPVTINRPENMDVQFMPEGGNLVAGIPAKVGFKAISEDGKGTDITGKIVNSKNQTITQIQTIHKGMGSFELIPEANESYIAVINLPNKTTKSYPLPKVNPGGTALRITNKGDDSLEITLTTAAPGTNNYYLIGQSRGVVCYAAAIKFNQASITRTINQNLFPTGIARFTLLNQSDIPLNERITYINNHDNLNITINTGKSAYITRDSIALNIEVKDKDGNPVDGAFGLAVTDNRQVKADTTGSNILNDLLFTSDLKGTIEEPGWYFDPDIKDITAPDSYRDASATQKAIALDNLLLTQGWVGYDWKQVFDLKIAQPKYEAEPEFMVKGRITGPFNNSVGRAAAVLYLKTRVLQRDTATKIDDMPTDKMGYFTFKSSLFTIPRILKGPHPAVIDTSFTESLRLMIVGIGKARNTGLEILNEFKPPVFTANGTIPPWYVNSDTTLLNNNATKNEQLKAEANYRGEGHLLKEVKIKEKKIIPGSHNLNGPGEADQLLDERELQKAGKMSLGELLEKKIKGFTVYGLWSPHYYDKAIPWYYLIKDKAVRIVIDGVDLEKLYDGSRNGPQGHDRYTFLKGYLDYYTAEDITGIEVMYNTMYGSKYALAYLPDPMNISYAYIEITTRSGSGPYLKTNALLYTYKPLAFSIPKKFYQPRYTVKNNNIAPGTDLRSAIHWEPNVITDKDGKATVSFFSADKPADYTIIMEGTDLNGSLGYKRQQIKVVSATALK